MSKNNYNTQKVEDEIIENLIDNMVPEHAIRTFDEDGMMTHDNGFTLTTNDGSQFQVTIIQTRAGE